ncbi:hypothetical protein MRQ36_26495 [Micromonospora sp. R77]|uniref:hypothetical protein n=1 Tax=Micromonospora sp. R77 TaxID=2925836 RepID=UPI001F603451|nr:hypothetical protein [Micromonospora sp. R77]MCI4065908.1 hypothetical protein [Micromonospora sp. R77]
MRLSRIIMALTVGLAVAAVPTAAGAAQPQPQPSTSPTQPAPYPPQPPVLTLDDPTIFLGQTFTLRGSGFTPNTTATIDVTVSDLPAAAPAAGTARQSDGSTVALAPVAYVLLSAPLHFTVQVDQNGNFTTTYRPDRIGRYTFTARDAVTGQTAVTTGTVLPPRQPRPPHHHGGLPVTGSSLSTPMKLGGGLVGAGAVLLLLSLAWRRRGRFGLGSR